MAGSLAALAIDLRYPVGVLANGLLTGSDQPLRLLPGRSPDQLVHIMELLALVTPYVITPIEVMLLREVPRLPWGATVVVVTAVVYDKLLAALLEMVRTGRQVLLFTLAEKPPAELLPGVRVVHLPHLVADLIAPVEVAA